MAKRKRETAFDKACKAEKEQQLQGLYNDEEAMKAVRYLASKYTAEEIIDQWWKMERGQ